MIILWSEKKWKTKKGGASNSVTTLAAFGQMLEKFLAKCRNK